MKILKMRRIMLFFLALFFFSSASFVNAQFKDELDCLENLSLEKIDFSKEVAKEKMSYLQDYILCQTAAMGNSKGCTYHTDSQRCKDNYVFFVDCYSKLASSGRVSQETANACMKTVQRSKVDPDQFNLYLQAIAQSNPKICENIKDSGLKDRCSAIAARRVSACDADDRDCEQIINYLRAVSENKEDYCKRIDTNNMSKMCLGSATRSERICRECRGFASFKQFYCRKYFGRKK